jgi:hypothetical protein
LAHFKGRHGILFIDCPAEARDCRAVRIVLPTTWKSSAGGNHNCYVQAIVIRLIPAVRPSRWVEIIDTTAGGRVVTAIEILSPGNKRSGKLNRLYRRKLNTF